MLFIVCCRILSKEDLVQIRIHEDLSLSHILLSPYEVYAFLLMAQFEVILLGTAIQNLQESNYNTLSV